MKLLLIPVVMAIFGTGAGVGAGVFLGGTEVPHGAAGQEVQSAATEFVSLHNEFMVPVVKNDRIDRMMVLTLSIEVDEGSAEAVHQRQPKLRDAFLRVMFDHASAGGFDGNFYSSSGVDRLRAALHEVAVASIGPQARDVLIVNLVQQTL